jgi:hypothetical protein
LPVPGIDTKSLPGEAKTVYETTSYTTPSNVHAFVLNPTPLSEANPAGSVIIACEYTAATAATALAGNADIVLNTVNPAVEQIHSSRINAGCILVQFVGNLMNANGEVMLGTLPYEEADVAGAILNGTSWNALSTYPGVTVVSVQKLLEQPMRVALRHSDFGSWQFGDGMDDTQTTIVELLGAVDLPFIAFKGVNGGLIRLTFVKNFECKSSLKSTDIIPYEATNAGKASDEASMTNAQAYLTKLVNTVTTYLPHAQSFARKAMVGDWMGTFHEGSKMLDALTQGAVVLTPRSRVGYRKIF